MIKAFLFIFMAVLAIFPLQGCSGEEGHTNLQSQSRVVEETEMPESWEQRQYAATEDPDRGEKARTDLEQTEDSLRAAGEDLRSAGEHGMDAAKNILTGEQAEPHR